MRDRKRITYRTILGFMLLYFMRRARSIYGPTLHAFPGLVILLLAKFGVGPRLFVAEIWRIEVTSTDPFESRKGRILARRFAANGVPEAALDVIRNATPQQAKAKACLSKTERPISTLRVGASRYRGTSSCEHTLIWRSRHVHSAGAPANQGSALFGEQTFKRTPRRSV